MNDFDEINLTGWVKQPDDPRDLVFSSPVDPVTLPSRVRLHMPQLGPPFEPAFNQGSLGSCGPCTMIAAATYCEMAAGEVVPQFSALFLYYNARQLMGTVGQDSGVDNRNLMKAAVRFGLAPESAWPYYVHNFTTRPSAMAYELAAKNKVVKYEAVPQTLTAMRQALAGTEAKQGRPIIFGFRVFESYMSDRTRATGFVALPRPGEAIVGGHDVAIVGYDDAQEVFVFKNSAGPQWGENGYGTISYQYALNPELASDFWVPYTLNND